jgi:MFS transporter, DHA2 family, multidrug resistance protein
MALQALTNLRGRQSSALAYFDVFFIVALALIVLLFFMKHSVAEKGAHVAEELNDRMRKLVDA